MNDGSYDYQRIEKALNYIHDRRGAQPDLAEVAAHVHMSRYHFQRLFKRWAGISPKKFLQFLTLQHAKSLLRNNRNLLDSAHESGLSGPGRLHDLFVTWEGATPGDYKTGGASLEIVYGFHPSPFGRILLANTSRGICGLSFVTDPDRALAELKAGWPRARFSEQTRETRALADEIFHVAAAKPLRLFLKGTPFQRKVWEALLMVPEGGLTTYGRLAERVGMPRAARAVGNAVGRNPVAYLIPCHRVIRELGGMGGYRWGRVRKLALIGWEASRHEARSQPVMA